MNNIAYLFDLDGVVIDTENQYNKFWSAVGEEYLPLVEDFSLKIKGNHLNNIYQFYLSHLSILEWESVVANLRIFEQEMEFEYIEGVESFLEELNIRKELTGLVTSSDEKKLNRVFAKLPNLKSYFRTIVCANDVKKGKPNPDCYLLAAERLDIEPQKCVVFEDAVAGIMAGNDAGMYVIGVATTNKREELLKYTQKIIPDFRDFCLRCL